MPPNHPAPDEDPFDDPFDFGGPFSFVPEPAEEEPPSHRVGRQMATLAMEATDLSELLAELSNARPMDLANSFRVSSYSPGQSWNKDTPLLRLMLARPPKSGVAIFLERLGSILVATESPTYRRTFTEEVQTGIYTLLERRNVTGSTHETSDTALALDIQRLCQVPVTPDMHAEAEKRMKEFVREHPDDASAYVTGFGISSDFVRKQALEAHLLHPDLIASLRSQGVLTLPNNDPELQQEILQSIEHLARHHRENLDTFRVAYDIPQQAFKTAVWKGLVESLVWRLRDNPIAEFKKSLETYGIPLDIGDAAARAKVIEGIDNNFQSHLDYAVELQKLFAITTEELAPVKAARMESLLRRCLLGKDIDMDSLRKGADVLGISEQEIHTFARHEFRDRLRRHEADTDKWEGKMCSLEILKQEDHQADALQALSESIQAGTNWYKLGPLLAACGPARPLFDAQTSNQFARERYLYLLGRADRSDVEKLRDVCDLSLVIGSQDERQAALQGMRYALLGGGVRVEDARALYNEYHLTPEELQDAANNAALTHLGAGWLAQLEVIRREFDVEEILFSERGRKQSGAIVARMVGDLSHARQDQAFKRQFQSRTQETIFLKPEDVEKVMKTIAIGGYDADSIEQGLRSEDGLLLPAYEEGNLPAFLELRRRCPGFCQAFEREDVRTHAREYIRTNLEKHNAKKAREHLELAALPQAEITDAAMVIFLNLLTSDKPEKAFSFARDAELDYSQQIGEINKLLETKPMAILNSLEFIPGRVIQRTDPMFHLAQYAKDLCIPSEMIYRRYVELASAHDVIGLTAYVNGLKTQLDSLVSSKAQDSSVSQQPYYQELMQIAYPNISGESWTNFEANETCEDRTEDLAGYKIRDSYSFTISPGSDMALKTGRHKNEVGLKDIHAPVEKAHARFEPVHFERETMLQAFDADLAPLASGLRPPEAFTTREEKLFGLLLEQSAGRLSVERFKDVLIAYQYAEFEDIRQYIDGTRGRAEQTRNPEYAYLLELREFFADRLKDVSRRIVERALANPQLRETLPRYFKDIANHEAARLGADAVNKMQIDKLGLSDGFLRQIAKSLKTRTGQDYSFDKVRALIAEYEERTAGMAEVEPPADYDLVVYKQIRAQRERTIRALQTLSGTTVHPSEVKLGEIDLQRHLAERRSFQAGTYDEDVFATYVGRQFNSVFQPELSFLDEELSKYEPKDAERKDAKPKRVEAFITKNHTSAHARGASGVCVAGDNPNKGERNQWQMKNYFQMVLRDAETKLCKGCVLLHLEEDGGKKILTASMNPSSTYLYQVNEEEMFKNLREQLIVFAKDNDIDAIAVSRHKNIRTNRTGGLFERALDASIAAAQAEHMFQSPRDFSIHPSYKQDVVDFIWSKEMAA